MKVVLRARKSKLYISLFSTIVFLLTVKIEYLSYLSNHFTQIQNVGRLGLIVVLVFSLLYTKRVTLNHIVYLFGALTGVVLVSTFIGNGSISSCVNAFSPMLAIGLMLEINRRKEDILHTILNTWKILLTFLVLADLVTILVFPNGMYQSRLYEINWLLGYKTQRYILVFPMILLSGYLQIKKFGKIKATFIFISLLGFADCYLAEATGCFVSLAIFLILFVLFSFMTRKKSIRVKRMAYSIMNYKSFFFIYMISFVSIVLIQNFAGIISILSLLEKNATFSGRTVIWANTFDVVKKNILLGIGYLSSEGFVKITGMAAGTNAHNMILQLLVFGGVVALALYVMIAVKAMKRGKNMYSMEEMLLVAGIYSLFILGLVSATMVISAFGLLPFWLLEHENET